MHAAMRPRSELLPRARSGAIRDIGLACLLGDPCSALGAPAPPGGAAPSARWLAACGLPALRTGLLLDGDPGVATAAVAALCDLALLWCAPLSDVRLTVSRIAVAVAAVGGAARPGPALVRARRIACQEQSAGSRTRVCALLAGDAPQSLAYTPFACDACRKGRKLGSAGKCCLLSCLVDDIPAHEQQPLKP